MGEVSDLTNMSKKTVIALSLIIFGLLLIGGVVYAYDASHKDKIAKGVKVGNIDIGGMSTSAAKMKLKEDFLAPFNRTLKITYHAKEFHLTAREAKVSADVQAMVNAALAKSRQGSIFDRTFRAVTGEEVTADIPADVTYSRAAVARKASQIKRAVARAPVNASLDFSPSGFKRVAARDGLAVDTKKLKREIASAIVAPRNNKVISVSVTRVKPKVATADLESTYHNLIVVNRGAFKLTYYRNLKPKKTYTIAVGKAGLETPAGLYNIQDKQVNPSWHVPNSDWAGDLAGKVIPPGPDNPLKARWMGLYAGAGIHGTAENASLGSAASHGCIRMAVPDVIDLYDRVETGTPVYIS